MATSLQITHGIIHTASTAAAGVGAGLAQIPGSDAPAITSIQIVMIIAIAREHRAQIDREMVAKFLLPFAARTVGRGTSQVLIGWIPMLGNTINATTAAILTEAVGWAASQYFEERSSN